MKPIYHALLLLFHNEIQIGTCFDITLSIENNMHSWWIDAANIHWLVEDPTIYFQHATVLDATVQVDEQQILNGHVVIQSMSCEAGIDKSSVRWIAQFCGIHSLSHQRTMDYTPLDSHPFFGTNTITGNISDMLILDDVQIISQNTTEGITIIPNNDDRTEHTQLPRAKKGTTSTNQKKYRPTKSGFRIIP